MPTRHSCARRPCLFPFCASPVVLFLLGLPTGASARPDETELPSAEVQAAEQDAANGRFAAAKEKLAAVLVSPSSRPKDKDEAGTELARLEWRIDARPDAARARLERLIPGARKKTPPLLLLSRMELSLRRFDAAADAARQAQGVAGTNDERRTAVVALARALTGGPVLLARDGRPSAFENDSRARLVEALDLVRPIVREEPGLLAPSQVQLQAALLLGDGPHALEAWRSYYTASGAADSSVLAGPRAVLGELLPRWRGAAAGRADREAIVKALRDSRFFTEAVSVARDPRPREEARVDGEPWVKDLVRYESYVRDVTDVTDRYYGDVARGNPDAKKWRKRLVALTETLWKRVSWPGKTPPFDATLLDEKPDSALGDRFGTMVASGNTGGVPNLHMGHRVVDETRAADQYGRHASIRFIALDAIVSDGYETWMWDGRGAHGGWGSAGLIVQIRPAYAEGAIRIWQQLADPQARDQADRRVVEETERDDARAAKDPFAYLPGLAFRLARQGAQAILDELAAKGLTGNALRTAFIAEVDRAVIETSIFAHEGRHAIDHELDPSKVLAPGLPEGSGAAREYRAKLSEIAFASRPRLAFDGILSANIGSPTPHGQANLKVVKGLVAWMDAHRAEIAGFDPDKPLLPQLDHLTDEQLRTAARSLDPMAPRK